MSIARAFLQAGAGAVIANLWEVDDEVSPIVLTFHEELRKRGDPAAALNAAQRHWLRDHSLETPVRAWGGYTVLGGRATTREQGR